MPLLQFNSEKDLVSFVVSAKLPEWQKKLFQQYADAVQVHSQGEVFYKIDRLFPNEHEESKKHRLLAFESITEASFGRAANNVNRVFKNSSYTVEASEATIKDANENAHNGMNLFNWFLDQWVKFALKQDANARIVVYPPDYAKEKEKPRVVFVESQYIKYVSPEVVVFISPEESTIEYNIVATAGCTEVFYDQSINRPNVREAQSKTYTPKLEPTVKKYVYHAFFKGFGFYRISQVEGKEYELEEVRIEQDFLPIMDVGGQIQKSNVNKSFLHPFVAFGNLALLQHSQHTAVNATFSFPRMSEIQTPCAAGCQDGKIRCESKEDIEKFGTDKPCNVCKGSGFTTNQTPYKVYVKQYDPQMQDDTKHLEVDDVKYYTPPTGVLDYSKKEWKDYLEMAETAVYINQRVATGNVQSAESKEIDREDMYSFLYQVGKCYFQRLRFVLQSNENYLVSNPSLVNVEAPYSLAILTEGEAFKELKDILSSDVPVMLKGRSIESFINKFVSMSSPIRKFLDVLKVVDPLLYYTTNEIAGFRANNIVTPDQYSTHVFAYPTLQNMYLDDPKLFMQDTKKIVESLKKELEQFKPKPVTDLRTQTTGQNQPVDE